MNHGRQSARVSRTWMWLPVRCLFPLLALVIIAGTLVWGAWVSLALALVSWRIVGRFG
ncbi:MAG: hypothetical protein KBD01_08280 [Acidobacteria bacterium]|nr:hypothetical protein [Acidobacteriota bacterium]